MKITTTTARWFVSPSRGGIILTINGTEYLMSLDETDKLAECLDEAAIFAKAQKRLPA